jgi:hypothetical protein
MSYKREESDPILSLIQLPIQLQDLHALFVESLALEKFEIELRSETGIHDAILETFADADNLDVALGASACLSSFVDGINRVWDLAIPHDTLDKDMTFGGLVEEINRMITENNLLMLRIDWKVLQTILEDYYDITLEKADLTGTVDSFLATMDPDHAEDSEDSRTLSDHLMDFIDSLYLDFSVDEIKKLDALSTMDKVYRVLNKKLSERKRNDCRVRHGNNWRVATRNMTREFLVQFGSYPIGVSMKSIISDKTGVIWHTGIEMEGGTEPILPDKGCYVVLMDKDIMKEYNSMEAMLDDGWAVD